MVLNKSQNKLKITVTCFILMYSVLLSFILTPSITCDSEENSLANFQTSEDSTITARNLRVDVDVGIEFVSDITAITYPDHYPGMPITLNCTVRNYLTQNIPTSFKAVFTIDDNVNDIPGYNYQANQTVTPAQLPPNDAVNLTWDWTPPLQAPPGSSWDYYYDNGHIFTAIFTTAFENDINSSNNQQRLNISILKPDFEIEVVSGWDGNQEPIKEIDLLNFNINESTFNFTVYNWRKPAWIDFYVDPPNGWLSTSPQSIFLTSFANSSNMYLSFTILPNDITLDSKLTQVEYPITLRAYCRSYPWAEAETDFTFKVKFYPRPEIIPSTTKTAQPGEVYCDFTVKNDGNGQDSFRSEATVGQTPYEIKKLKEQGWNASVESGKYSRILNRGENHTVTVKIEIPRTVPAGAPCLINLTVYSEKAAFACPSHPYAVASGFFYIYAAKFWDVDVQDYIPPVNMTPDSEVTIPFIIQNVGNDNDRTITCNVTEIPEGWNYTLDTSDIPYSGLGRQSFADIELTIQTPKKVNAGKYTIRVVAISEGDIKDESNITIQILSSKGVKLSSEANWFVIEPGLDNIFNVSIENLGNSFNYFNLVTYCEPAQVGLEEFIELEYTSILLGPYAQNNLSIIFRIPMSFPVDSNLHTFNLDNYNLQIVAAQNKAPKINNSLNVGIHINPYYNFEPLENFLIDYIVRGSGVGFSTKINISNTGNFRDTVRFSIEGINGSNPTWLIMPYKLELEFQEYNNLIIDIDSLPFDTPLDDYEFIINCISDGNKLLIKPIKLVLKVIDYDLIISNVRIEDKLPNNFGILEGLKAKITADISYKFQEIKSAKYQLPIEIDPRNSIVNITLFDNTREVFNGTATLEFSTDNHTQELKLYWPTMHVGRHRLTIMVDPEDNIPESNENNNTAEFFVHVESPLTADSENSYIILITSNVAIIITSSVILIGFTALIGGTEVGKFKILVGLLPLYTRIKRDKILDHEARGMIRGYIIANPGVHFNYLKRELGLKNGSLAYHLKVLERGEFIKIQRDGMYTRCYPMKNGAYYKGAFNGVRLSEIQKKIVRQIRIKPGITQKKIITQTGIKQQTVSRNINALVDKDVIKVQKKGRKSCCYFNSEIELEDS